MKQLKGSFKLFYEVAVCLQNKTREVTLFVVVLVGRVPLKHISRTCVLFGAFVVVTLNETLVLISIGIIVKVFVILGGIVYVDVRAWAAAWVVCRIVSNNLCATSRYAFIPLVFIANHLANALDSAELLQMFIFCRATMLSPGVFDDHLFVRLPNLVCDITHGSSASNSHSMTE